MSDWKLPLFTIYWYKCTYRDEEKRTRQWKCEPTKRLIRFRCGGRGLSSCVFCELAKPLSDTNPTGSAGYPSSCLFPSSLSRYSSTARGPSLTSIPCFPIHPTSSLPLPPLLQHSVFVHCCVSVTLATVIQLRTPQTRRRVLWGSGVSMGIAWIPN